MQALRLALLALKTWDCARRWPMAPSGKSSTSIRRGRIDLWEQAQSVLINPVEERIFCDDLLSDEHYPACGINALAHYTWLNPDPERIIMMTVKQLREFRSSGTLVRPNEFDGNIIIEAWKYPPVTKIGTKTEWVDRLSLAASLRDNYDARVQGDLTRLIEQAL